MLYAREYGWNQEAEALFAQIAANFVEKFDPKRERCWIAERHGVNVGCVFLVKKSATIAQLRLLHVEASARGMGIGKRLVRECVDFARQAGYRKIILGTNDVLHAARHLYVAQGFRLVKEERHHSFGTDLVGQYWELLGDSQNRTLGSAIDVLRTWSARSRASRRSALVFAGPAQVGEHVTYQVSTTMGAAPATPNVSTLVITWTAGNATFCAVFEQQPARFRGRAHTKR